MKRLLLVPLCLCGLLLTQARAGFVDIDQTSYSSDMFINVTDGDGNQTVNPLDIVTTVQLFAYTDANSAAKTAIAITRTEVASNASKLLTFAAPTASASQLETALAGFTNGSGVAGLEATDNTGTTSWALLTYTGTTTLSAAGFDFTAANFGLTTSAWTIDATAALSFQEYKGSGLVPNLTTQYPDGGVTASDGDSSGYNQKFAYDLTAVRDNGDDVHVVGEGYSDTAFTKLSSTSPAILANLGTLGSYNIAYGYVGTAPTGTNFSSSAVVVDIPNPSAVPEPSSLAMVSLIGICVGVVRRRRK